MGKPKSRRAIAEKTMKQMPLDKWIRFTALAQDCKLTRSELGAFLREARKKSMVKRKLEGHTCRALWKRIAPIVNF